MIYVVVRRTTDWENETTFRAQIPEWLVPVVDLWNETFQMPYHLFRAELRRIARLNLSRIPGAACVPREEVPAGALVVPVDDDDWFSPHLATVLENHVDGRHTGFHWISEFLEVPISMGHRLGLIRRAIFPHTPPKWLCTTNNYAVMMSGDAVPLLDNHMKASRWFIAHPAAVKRLDERLSIMNRTLASTTSLWSKPSRAALVRKFHRYEKLYNKDLASELSWCTPYVEMMRNLMERLRLRR